MRDGLRTHADFNARALRSAACGWDGARKLRYSRGGCPHCKAELVARLQRRGVNSVLDRREFACGRTIIAQAD